MPFDGVLVIDKPAGPTSHDVVGRARRALGISRIGHTGTLDPFATGVLPLVIGRATRLAQFLAGADKSYEAVVSLGVATDTYDSLGRPIDIDATTGRGTTGWPGRADIDEALDAFRGTFQQMPPPFSAKKVEGVRAHALARRGRTPALTAVSVSVRELVLTSIEDSRLSLRLTCAAGLYVRALAHELGLRLGCGAHLASLRRMRAGEFSLDAAVPLSDLEADPASARERLVPMSRLLATLPGVSLAASGLALVRHGRLLLAENLADKVLPPPDAVVRLVDPGGELVGLARPDAGSAALHPFVVLM